MVNYLYPPFFVLYLEFPFCILIKPNCFSLLIAVPTCGKEIGADIQLPLGTCLTTVAITELHLEEVGPALEFSEFCASFGKA